MTHGARCVTIMRLLIGLLSYVLAAVAIVGGGAGLLLFSTTGEAVTVVPAQQEARKVSPRIQEWLDRKAEARAYAEREQAAALAEKERAEAARVKTSASAAHAAFARARADDQHAAERDSLAQRRDSAKREAKRRPRQLRVAQPSAPPQASHQQSYYPDLHGRSQ
jgi:hypothetical protein